MSNVVTSALKDARSKRELRNECIKLIVPILIDKGATFSDITYIFDKITILSRMNTKIDLKLNSLVLD